MAVAFLPHRVMVACRDGRLYSIKEGDVRGTAVLTGNVIDLGAQAIAMAREDKVQCGSIVSHHIFLFVNPSLFASCS